MWSNLSFKGSDGCNLEISLFRCKDGIRLRISYTLLEKWCWRCYRVVQSLSHVWLFVTPWTATHQASLSFTISGSLLKLMSIESVMPSNHLILCHPFLLPLSIFPSTGSFPVNWLFASGGQNTEASASASVPPMNIQVWFPLGLTYLITLLSKGPSRVFSSTTIWKHQFFSAQPSLGLFIIHSVKYLSFSLAFTIAYSLLQYQCSFPFFYTGD